MVPRSLVEGMHEVIEPAAFRARPASHQGRRHESARAKRKPFLHEAPRGFPSAPLLEHDTGVQCLSITGLRRVADLQVVRSIGFRYGPHLARVSTPEAPAQPRAAVMALRLQCGRDARRLAAQCASRGAEQSRAIPSNTGPILDRSAAPTTIKRSPSEA